MQVNFEVEDLRQPMNEKSLVIAEGGPVPLALKPTTIALSQALSHRKFHIPPGAISNLLAHTGYQQSYQS